MQATIRTLIAALALAATACTDGTSRFDEPAAPSGTVRVTVGAASGIGVGTRTQLDDDGRQVRWIPGDRIALWAVNDANTVVLDAQCFEMLHYNASFDSARFTADIEAMPSGSYSYYAVSPTPAATAGTKATFDIPAVQNGSQQLACDVMVAEPVTNGGALIEGDNSDALSLHFSHKVHVLKIHLPANRMEQPISQLTLTFPVPVVGRLTVDAADPDAAIELPTGEAGKVLTLSFDSPKDAGDTVFAVIAPVELNENDEIEIKAYAGALESAAAHMPGKNYRAGHTTPVNLTIPERYRITRILFSLAGRDGALNLPEDLADGYGCSTLGEPIRSFRIVKSDTGEVLGEFSDINAMNTYQIFYEGKFRTDLSGAEVTVQFESDHATVERRFILPEFIADQINTVPAFEVPWLFEEDFSGVDDFTGPGKTGDAAGVELTSSGLPGWYAGARSKGIAQKCVNLQSYSNIGGPYASRIDSRPMSNITDGTVTLSIAFNADWKKNKSSSMNLLVGRTSEHSLNSTISDSTSIPMRDNSSASAENIPTRHEVTIPGFTNSQSIAWKTEGKNGTMFNYEDLYIDNIRVSIVR